MFSDSFDNWFLLLLLIGTVIRARLLLCGWLSCWFLIFVITVAIAGTFFLLGSWFSNSFDSYSWLLGLLFIAIAVRAGLFFLGSWFSNSFGSWLLHLLLVRAIIRAFLLLCRWFWGWFGWSFHQWHIFIAVAVT